MKQMRSAISALVVLTVHGCAYVPMERIAPHTFETGRTPYSAAICIARNARSMSGMSAEERMQGEVAWEVVIRESGRSAHVAAADIQPRAAGSVVAIRVVDAPRGGAAAFAQRLMSDCQAQAVK